jgi:hypothetical protein
LTLKSPLKSVKKWTILTREQGERITFAFYKRLRFGDLSKINQSERLKELALVMVSHLFSRRKLSIPGVGILSLKKLPAKKKVHEAKLYGPSLLIDFEEDTSLEESALMEELVARHQWSRNEARQKLTDLGGKIINDVLNFGEAHIMHLGRFRKAPNKAFTFEIDPQIQKSFKMTYPDLALQIVPDKKKQELSKKLQEDYLLGTNFEKKDKIGWFFPLLALIATSLLLACLITCFFQKNQKVSFTPIIEKPGELITNSSSDPQQSSSAAFDSAQSEDDIQTGIDSSIEDPIGEDDLFREDDFSDESQDSSQDPEESQSSNLPTFSNFEDIENQSLDFILQESAAKRLAYNKACMIVVGSYMRRDLIDKMVRKLQKENYDIYIEKYGSFYRTAIIYECNEKNTSDFLQMIRSNIEEKAWILEY